MQRFWSYDIRKNNYIPSQTECIFCSCSTVKEIVDAVTGGKNELPE